MFQTNRIFKNNMLLSVYILLCLQTLHVYSETISVYSFEDGKYNVLIHTLFLYHMKFKLKL